jgi:pilus assembly protein FimV
MSQPEHERRTIQNTNDILSVYDLLSEMDGKLAKQSVQLGNIASKVEAHDARFDAHDARFDAHGARFDAHDARFDGVDQQLQEILRRLTD